MKIVDIKVERFTAMCWTKTSPEGHQVPAWGHEVEHPLLVIVTDEGAEGYYLPFQQPVPSDAFQFPERTKPTSAGKPQPDVKHGSYAGIVEKIVKPALIGEDPFSREKIYDKLWKMQRGHRQLNDRLIAHIDLALWDLAGRALGQPVYKLLGGHRTKVKAYASAMVGDHLPGGLDSPQAYADFAAQCQQKGYRAFKLHTWADREWTEATITAAPDPVRDVEACQAVRERVGAGMELMLDPYHYYNREQALYIGRELEKLDFAWLEEPMDEYQMSSYVWLAEHLDIPVIGPEVHAGKMALRAEWIAQRASDICRAGALNVGGLTPLMKIAGMCAAFGVRLELHGPGPGHLHAMAAMTIPGEYYERGLLHPYLDYDAVPEWLNSSIEPLDEDGYVRVPDRAGLGWDINFDYIREHKVQ